MNTSYINLRRSFLLWRHNGKRAYLLKGVNLMKKLIISLIIISLIVSLIFNINQHRTINIYKQNQYLLDSEMKQNINMLNNYLVNINFNNFNEDNLRVCLWESSNINILASKSSSRYHDNHYIIDCFTDINNVFVGWPMNRIKSNGEQIKTLLKSTIDTKNNEINQEGCKKLSEFIRSNI